MSTHNLKTIWQSGLIPSKLATKYLDALEQSKIVPEPLIYCALQGALTLNVEPVLPEHLIEDESKREWYVPDYQPNQPVVDLLNEFNRVGRKIVILYHSNLRHVAEVRYGSEHFIDKFKSGEWGFKRQDVKNYNDPRVGPLAELLIHNNPFEKASRTGQLAEALTKFEEEANDRSARQYAEREYAENYLISTPWQKAVSLILPPAAFLALAAPEEKRDKAFKSGFRIA